MIRALEEQVTAWAARVAAESTPLFGSPTLIAGSLDATAVPEGQSAIAAAASRFASVPEDRDLGPAPVTEDDMSRLRAEVTVLLVGPATGAGGLTVAPPGATVHQVDLLALTLLARLRERTLPGADGAADWHGGSRGSITAQVGDRVAELRWAAMEAAAPMLVEAAGQRRLWRLHLEATIEFRLSTLPVDGGRIRYIDQHTDFVPADRLPLAYFAGMESFVLNRLARREITRLGDLAGLDPVVLADELDITDAVQRQSLANVTFVATSRRAFPTAIAFTDAISEVFWLPARALIQPTAGEQALLIRARQKPVEAIALAVLGMGTASILRPDLLEQVLVGRLLSLERVL